MPVLFGPTRACSPFRKVEPFERAGWIGLYEVAMDRRYVGRLATYVYDVNVIGIS